tara:strand:- start:1052 stop:1636 length:585 start_codon:yes stop_codon:yes gene_type:complete
MKKFLTIIILNLCFIIPSQADDISDLQIDGMSIGNSLLDYFSEEEIKFQLSRTVGKYKSKKIKRVYFNAKGDSKYSQYNFHFITDSSYRIVNVSGVMIYENKIDECYKKQKKIINDIEKNFKTTSKETNEFKHRSDKSGKSKVNQINLKLKNGRIRAECRSWSKKIKKEKPWRDTLSIVLDSNEYLYWLQKEAY